MPGEKKWTTIRVTPQQAETIKNLSREISLRDHTDVDASGVVAILLRVYKGARLSAETAIA